MDPTDCIRAHDEWARGYDSYEERAFFRFLTDVMNAQIDRFLPPSGRILDAAGGTGTLAIELAERGYDVTYTELSDEMIDVCGSKKGSEKITITKADLTDMNAFEDDSFDLSLCIGNAVSYCDAHRAVSELARVTKPGSIVMFDVHSFYQLQRACARNGDEERLTRLNRTGLYHNGHYDQRAFTREALRTLVEAAGLECVTLFGKIVLANVQDPKRMDVALASASFYEVLFDAELEVFERDEYLSSALELGVVARVTE